MTLPSSITINAAREHNLKNLSLSFPKNKLIVVTGVSGSGKSSLVYDVIYREAERRYLGSFNTLARQFMGKMHQPDVGKIEGLAPAIALNQRSVVSSSRSTVGTITGIHDLLRLLFARAGKPSQKYPDLALSRSLFSFNTQEGACPFCKGLGVEDFLDPELLISDGNRSLRQGALVITAPNGYIIYSQVTLDVLDQVCRAEGFHIDIPWNELTPEQKQIVLYGSDKIEIPFGKHPLESRMKWSGITAKPRELGYYKGILPVMEEILRRDRNKNILRFVRTVHCRACRGTRLNEKALSVTVNGMNIAQLADLQMDELRQWFDDLQPAAVEMKVALPVRSKITGIIDMISRLGLGYLAASRESSTLSGGEAQRLRLAGIATLELSDMIFIFDEPSVGLHPHDTGNLIGLLKGIRDRGNTVIVVEHEASFIQHADWLIDIGPGPGRDGGEVVFNGPVPGIIELQTDQVQRSRTLSYLLGYESIPLPGKPRSGSESMVVSGAFANNLKDIDVTFRLHALNVITGVSGAGKSSLADQVVSAFFQDHFSGKPTDLIPFQGIHGYETIRKVITIDQSPIGRTPRSNPATYTGLFDHIRDLFARQPGALEKGFDKSRFSFNTEGGRCEACQGAGYQQVGMHFMENVEVPCEACEGRRFDPETLSVTVNGKNISGILEMTVDEAITFFREEQKLLRFPETLAMLGLGYLTLGQRSSTLSGGEAQRIKLAAELAKPAAEHTLYIMDEPTTGLHQADVEKLLKAIDNLVALGHTVILTEHHLGLIAAADHIIDLGPGSGRNGGQIVAMGSPETVARAGNSLTGKYLDEYLKSMHEFRKVNRAVVRSMPEDNLPDGARSDNLDSSILVRNATTHNLKHISADIPKNRLTVITGVSGSGKSSLAFDTIHAESQRRFLDGFSAYVRTKAGIPEKADVESIGGLSPSLALSQSSGKPNPRSTVGTFTGIYDLYRLLYARLGRIPLQNHDLGTFSPEPIVSSLFSFNHLSGACPVCKGLGSQTLCDPVKLITHPERSILNGAMDGTKTGKFYGDPVGQYTATLKAVGEKYAIDFSLPWQELDPQDQSLALYGAGETVFEVIWEYQRGQRTGDHRFTGKWKGITALVEEEYDRKHADHRGEAMMNVMSVMPCRQCNGQRLNELALSYETGGLNISGLAALPVKDSLSFFHSLPDVFSTRHEKAVAEELSGEIIRRLEVLAELGLAYLAPGRPLDTLSAGETRRVRIAAQIGSGLTGITYILDEPTAGLHPRDTAGLLKQIRSLVTSGNTVILVEHDRDVILAADHIIDLGPGAGNEGGTVVASGSPEMIMNNPASLTGQYLSGKLRPVPRENRVLKPGLNITDAFMHNLKHFNLDIPSGGIVAVTGVSGSGKSSLVFDLVYASWQTGRPVGCKSVTGFNRFSRVVAAEQKTGFSAGNAIVATWCGLMDPLRDLMAEQPEAKRDGFGKNYFSFLTKQGQCPVCEGDGMLRVSMDFLPDLVTECEHCKGTRFNSETLSVEYQGKNIAGILDMTVRESLDFFHKQPKITGILRALADIGLDYLKPGQRLSALSGGEAQRLHLAAEMVKPATGPSLFLFDEPATGLHFHDIRQLINAFDKLASRGHTLLVIEHDPTIIASADYLIELGPEGGNEGGYLVTASSRLQ